MGTALVFALSACGTNAILYEPDGEHWSILGDYLHYCPPTKGARDAGDPDFPYRILFKTADLVKPEGRLQPGYLLKKGEIQIEFLILVPHKEQHEFGEWPRMNDPVVNLRLPFGQVARISEFRKTGVSFSRKGYPVAGIGYKFTYPFDYRKAEWFEVEMLLGEPVAPDCKIPIVRYTRRGMVH